MENQLLIALSRNKLLKNIDIAKIDLHDVKGKLITLGEGEILYREGDTAEIIFLLVSGQINVLKKRLLGKTKSYLFRENDFFGHEEYFEETSRTSTAVALVDSYLIALTREEMDILIKQEDEILVNLKEPVPENFVEDLLRKEKEHVHKPVGMEKQFEPSLKNDDEHVLRPTVVDEEKTMDFFKSISDFSRSRESNLIQPLEPFEDNLEIVNIAGEESPVELPQETSTLPEAGSISSTVEPEQEIPNQQTAFDENLFLNEDGIPKAEFELPGDEPAAETGVIEELKTQDELHETQNVIEPVEPQERGEEVEQESTIETGRNFNNGLDDALFQILSGGEVLNFEPNRENAIAEKPGQAQTDFILRPEEDKNESETPLHVEEETEDVISEPLVPAEIKNEADNYLPEPPLPAEPVAGEAEPIVEHVIDDTLKAVNIFPEEYGAGEDNIPLPAEDKKMDLHYPLLAVLERINSSVNLNEVIKNIADVSKMLTSSDATLVFQIDWSKNEIWTMVETGFSRREVRSKIGEGIAGQAVKNGETVIANCISKDKRFNFDLEKKFCESAGSVLVFPIKDKKNEIVAALELIKKRPFEFSGEHEEKLKTLSVSFANAVRNAEQVESIAKKEREFALSKVAAFLEQEIKKPMLLGKRYADHLRSKQLPQDVNNILNSLSEQLNAVTDIVTSTANYSEEKIPLRVMNVSLNNSLKDFGLKAEQYVESRFTQIVNEFGGDATVKMDVKEFFQCYNIIIKNACDAMPDGGKIIVSTKKLDNSVEIHIKDNGYGISDEIKLKIFDPFFSEGKRDGTGIGLAVAKKIILAHNGSIGVYSSVGEGADFIITLPTVSAF